MYQGLGQTYINVFFWLTTCSFATAGVAVLILRLFKQIRLAWCVIVTLLLSVTLAYFTNSAFHREMFVREHQKHNTLVPQSGCVLYDPSFGRLYATYRMSRAEFDAWVSEHPWKLIPYDQAFVRYDGERLGFTEPDSAFATEMASNGGQLRVYFKEDMMYLSYNVM